MNINETDIAWAAGLFEGEGSISLHTGGLRPVLALRMSDKDVVECFSAIVNGALAFDRPVSGPWLPKAGARGKKPLWTWHARNVCEVQQVLRLFWSYLGDRRREQSATAFARYYEYNGYGRLEKTSGNTPSYVKRCREAIS